ncbi:hypothetical protein KAI32_02495 [Candidatus Pacearchaeota archaeon]|nr:hypothetical protein [Candidatus Pacearchaeota archaeon]
MDTKFFVIILFLVSFSFASAHDVHYDIDERYIYKEKITTTKYFPEENFIFSKTTYIDYDNDERFPTYDYRHGYTYRATTDYLDNYNKKKKVSKNYKKYPPRIHSYKDYHSKPNNRLVSYEKDGCYHTAPAGKLFYIKCK